MSATAHLWAIGFDSVERANRLRDLVNKLSESRCLFLLKLAVAERYGDGTMTLDGEPFVAVNHSRGLASFLAGLALGAPPLTASAVSALPTAIGASVSEAGIDCAFIREVEMLMKPGTSALFVLDQEGDMAKILQGIRGLGGKVLKTNVDVARAELIQSTLNSGPA
jgi:uncharacterized membrane protein